MIPLTLAEVADLVGGRLSPSAPPDGTVTGPVVVDSRLAAPGALFVALPGERADGHDFAPAAVAAGAVAVLGARAVVGLPTVVVGDAEVALGRLAAGVRDQLSAAVVGLTGSAGKTSTKDLLAQVLAADGPTVAPPGSHNNEVGLPLTVLLADAATRYLVLEMGARGRGHIAYLAGLARPQVGLVLNVGTAHVGEFGSRKAVAEAKGELVEALPADGLAVLNADDPLVADMAARTPARVVTFGRSPGASVRAEAETLGPDGRAAFTLVTAAGSAPVTLRVVGAHQVPNALAVAAVATELGLDLPGVAAALSAAGPVSRWRMEVDVTPDGVTVINDAYNANPESVRAALDALVQIGRGARTWAVLGEMRELGEESASEHVAAGRYALERGVAELVAVGAEARQIVDGQLSAAATGRARRADDLGAALALLRDELRSGDVVLVKASRAVGLERLAAALLEPTRDVRELPA